MDVTLKTKKITATRSLKRRTLSAIVAVTIATAFIPTKIAPLASLSPVREAQAQMGQGGPMNMIMMIVMMLLMGKMMNGQQGQPLLTGLQRDRAADGISNINNAINGQGTGIGVPAPGMPGFPNPNGLQPGAFVPQQPAISLPLSPGNNSPSLVIPLNRP